VGVAPAEPDLPADIDQLVRQAMSLGTTANLSRALKAHREEAESQNTDASDEGEVTGSVDLTDLLRRLQEASNRALQAHTDGNNHGLSLALSEIKTVVGQCDVPDIEKETVQTPTIMLTKVRRAYALVMEGLGDVERHGELVEALGLDGVTARMLAIARQPRVAMRADDPDRLIAFAATLQEQLNIKAVVTERGDLLRSGPARLLSSFSNGVRSLVVEDWLGDLHALTKREEGVPVNEPPWMVVPGELVLMRYRASRSGGRLKHLREGKLEAASEQRLAVVDLHLKEGILRILEGATDLSAAPGAIQDGFRRTLKVLSDQWHEQGVRILDPRTCSPAMDSSHTRVEENGGRLASGWPEWEEHSRSARLLFSPD